MLKRGMAILGHFFQQILVILLLSIFIIFVLVGIILYPGPASLQMDAASSIHDPVPVLFLIPPSDRGQLESSKDLSA